MIRAASREALRTLEQRVDAAADAASKKSLDSLSAVAGDLYDMAGVLAGAPQLRRLLGDASAPEESRTGLVDRLFKGKVGAVALDLARTVASLRWSTPWDMTDSLEIAGDRLLLDLADRQRELDAVEDELFRFGRILDADDELRGLLDEHVVPAARRSALLHGVLDGKASPVTVELLDRALRSGRTRSVVLAVDNLLNAAAARRQRSTALVRTAVMLTDQQSSRLASVLAGMYGRQIDVRSEVDPSVRGGLIVRVADEVIDGSVAGRIAAVRDALRT
jgi:F-type H+-transporting ATPase subunit delta